MNGQVKNPQLVKEVWIKRNILKLKNLQFYNELEVFLCLDFYNYNPNAAFTLST